MDGVFEMQDFYAAGGFCFSHRNLRMRGIGWAGDDDLALRPLSELPFAEVAAFDRLHFGFDRSAFLRPWIDPAGGLGLGLVEEGRRHAMAEVFGCARMYLGPAPPLPWAQIFGITTFELG
jgi:hypothetical protein